jgi:hypothetical protein
VSTVTAQADLRAILREYLKDHLAFDAEKRVTTPAGRPVYAGRDCIGPERDATDADREITVSLLGDAYEALAKRDYASAASTVNRLMHGVPEEQRNALAHGVLEANVKALERYCGEWMETPQCRVLASI